MQISQGVGYAFHALLRMAQVPAESAATTEEMARSLGASPTYMAKLLQRLARMGLVSGQRGRGGGYCLARPAERITLWEVVAALQEKPAAAPFLPTCLACPLNRGCPLREALEAASRRTEQILSRVNVAKMARLIAEGACSDDGLRTLDQGRGA